ncbi:hypothetical protein HN446_04000 [bacterium]|jgi:hypothetical protein|nr:hypothetical protein [bacterium]
MKKLILAALIAIAPLSISGADKRGLFERASDFILPMGLSCIYASAIRSVATKRVRDRLGDGNIRQICEITIDATASTAATHSYTWMKGIVFPTKRQLLPTATDVSLDFAKTLGISITAWQLAPQLEKLPYISSITTTSVREALVAWDTDFTAIANVLPETPVRTIVAGCATGFTASAMFDGGKWLLRKIEAQRRTDAEYVELFKAKEFRTVA